MKLCDYGCGQEANHQFKNGKWCCSKYYTSCPVEREKIRKRPIDKNRYHQIGKKNKGKKRSNDFRERLRNINLGKTLSKETKKKLRIFNKKSINYWKQKYFFFSKIEEIRHNPNNPEEKEIQVRCKNHNCKNSKEKDGWFTPTYIQLYERMRQLENKNGNGGSYFYCSQECKDVCPLYGLRSDPLKETNPLPYTYDEYQIFRKFVLERDNYICQFCGKPATIVHHERPKKLEPFYTLDPDFAWSCCQKCHYKKGHKDECSTGQLAKLVCSIESQKFLNQEKEKMFMKKVVLSDNALQIASSRYFMEDEDWETCTYRVAKTIADIEYTQKEYYTNQFHNMIYNRLFVPGGRILRNAGRNKGSLFNCYVLPISDSIEEIGQFYKESLILWSNGGGVGANFSDLRPKGDLILGKGGTSSGLVSFLQGSDFLAARIESGGNRRAAGLACVDVSHPEVLDFIDAKLEDGKLRHYNISVGISNEFLEAVESDSDWEFKFKQRSYGKIKAREIWNKILSNMIKNAEPGLLNFSNLMKNNSYYYDPVISTNPCGEAVLSPHDICCLGSIVLPNFITGTVNTNWKKLEQIINLSIRFLDNVIEANKYVLKDNDIKGHASRRIGLGITGLADYLFVKNIRYGSEKSLIEIEKLFKFIRDCAYRASVQLAVEKGAFPKFDPIQYLKSSFIRKLPVSLRMEIKEKGIRNVTIMSIAPAGTISLITEYSSGIEPLFAKAMLRSDRVGKRIYVHPTYKYLLKNKKEIPEWYVDINDLEPKDHFEVQSCIQRFVDASISKTINLPSNTTVDNLEKLLLEYLKDLKGVTVYVDGSRSGQILNKLSKEEVMKYIKEEKTENELEYNDVKCATGNCDI